MAHRKVLRETTASGLLASRSRNMRRIPIRKISRNELPKKKSDAITKRIFERIRN